MGYQIGRAPSGVPAHEVGWSPEHTSGTIFDPTGGDVNIEMGGGNGGGAYGRGAVSSRDPQFPNHAWKRLADAVTAANPETPTDPTDPTSPTTPTTPSTPSTPETAPTTISGLAGNVASSFVSGQVSSLLGVLGIGDSPGFLAAGSQLGQNIKKPGDKDDKDDEKKLDPKRGDLNQKKGDAKKLREAEDKVTDAEASLKIAKQKLAETEANPKSQESSNMAARTRVDKLERELGQARADLAALKSQTARASGLGNRTFDRGGVADGLGFLRKATPKPERVLSPRQTESFEQMVRSNFQSGIGTDEVLARLDRLISLTESVYENGLGETNNYFPDYGSAREDAAAVRRDTKQRAMLGGL
jgi:hypothetical protein